MKLNKKLLPKKKVLNKFNKIRLNLLSSGLLFSSVTVKAEATIEDTVESNIS